MDALLLSAGYGKRLRPITHEIPKPLLPIVDRKLIDINIEKLLSQGVERIYINLYHRADKLSAYLKGRRNIKWAIEERLSGTGGALLNFCSVLKRDFLYHSGDVISAINIQRLLKFHLKKNGIATLALLKNPGTNFIELDGYRIRKIDAVSHRSYYTFSGIAIFSPRIFTYLPAKKKFSIAEVFERIIKNGEALWGLSMNMDWYNINTHRAYWKIHYDILKRKKNLFGNKIKGPMYIAPSSNVASRKFSGFVSIADNCYIHKDVKLKNVIVLPGTEVENGNFKDCIIGNRFCIRAR